MNTILQEFHFGKYIAYKYEFFHLKISKCFQQKKSFSSMYLFFKVEILSYWI